MSGVTKTQYGAEKTVQLTDAQILTLPAAGFLLIPAIAGRIILPQFVIFSLNPWLADYSDIDGAAAWGIDNAADGSGAYFGHSSDPGDVLAAGQSEMDTLEFIDFFDTNPLDLADLTGSIWLVFDNGVTGSPLGDGDPGNVLTVMVGYLTLPFVT